MKYTPGPWEVVITSSGDTLIDTPRYRWSLGRLMSKADAHLIAAAPELLEALREAITWDGWDQEGVAAVWLEQAQAAIAKAMGER